MDTNFRNFCIDNFDGCENGKIYIDEVMDVTEIDCNSEYIEDLHGISGFQNLEYIDCSFNRITYATFSNPKLKHIKINHNDLVEIDVTECPELKSIEIYCNPSMSGQKFIDLHNNLKFKEIQISECGNVDIVIPSSINSVDIINELEEGEYGGNIKVYRWDNYWESYNYYNPNGNDLPKPKPIYCI